MSKEPIYDETQFRGAEYFIKIKDDDGKEKQYPVDSKTYLSFQDKFGRLYGKRVRFQTTGRHSVSGILDNVILKLIPNEPVQ